MSDREWKTVWKADIEVDLKMQALEPPTEIIQGGQQHKMFRFISANNRDGAVVIVEKDDQIALVSHTRVAVGKISLELPQGMGDVEDSDGIETGMREAREELGVRVKDGVSLGSIHADTAVLGNKINVILCTYDGELGFNDGEVLAVHWTNKCDLVELVKLNKIEDGISISAIMKYLIYKNDL